MRINTYEEFQLWLAKEVEVREEFRSVLPSDMQDQLDLEPESLAVLETFLLDRYSSIDAAMRINERPVVDAAARHVGLVMILNIDGAEWAIDLENADSVYFKLPIIRFVDEDEECPLSMVTTSLDRRTGTFLRDLVVGYVGQYHAPS